MWSKVNQKCDNIELTNLKSDAKVGDWTAFNVFELSLLSIFVLFGSWLYFFVHAYGSSILVNR